MTNQELRKLRLMLDLTQAQMAEKLLITKEHYSACERGVYKISKRTFKLASQLNGLDMPQI